MKIKFTLIIVLLTGITLTYTACKKSNNNANGPALTPTQVSSQVALNLSETLYDGFGAFNLTGGLSTPGSLGLIHTQGGLRLNLATDPLCGVSEDTTLNYSTTANGTSASVKGTIGFSFICSSGVLSGFTVTDNLAVGESSSSFSLAVKLAENLTLVETNPQNINTNSTLNGTLSYGGTYNYTTGSKGSATQNYSYTFKSILLDSSGDIISGSATFVTSGSGTTGTWNYTGTVTFLGNGNATITISGKTYNVNLATGTVS